MAFDVFISYSHQDKDLRNELEKHLSNLRRQEVINSWYDGDIIPGTEWKQQIIAHLNTAQIILLLVSADFMDSDFCYSIEMKLAIARHNADQARVIPVILRPTDWKGAPFAKLKMLPTDGKPVTRWPTHDDAFEDIVQGMRAAVDDLIKKGNTAKPLGSPSVGSAQVPQHLGKRHAELSSWLAQTWLKEGPAVCFIEGFSGIGKTTLARDLLKNLGWNAAMVKMPDAGSEQSDDLFLDLAMELSDNGLNEMANAVDNGTSLSSALEGVLHKQVLIVIDEFQRALVDNTGRPISALERLLEKIANRPRLPGRVLLLSNRLVERGKWSEAFTIKTLSALELDAAELLLDRLLREANRSQDVPLARRRDVVNWLGRNPRAIRVLVASLEQDSLEELIGLSPESWELRDREVSPELLERLERELLERTLSHLKAETNTLLRQLSVHRKAVKREAIEMLLPQGATFASICDDLISRFLMEQHSGWFTLNPIVREISLQRLKANQAQLQHAHSKASDHYMRHFTAKNIVGGGQLGGYFVEARYHLVQSKRETDLSRIAERFENHLKASFHGSSPIPKERNELNERIAVLSALLERPGAKGLEYYLARLYEARGASPDLLKALTYVQRATGARARVDSWILRIRLEGKLNGPERALQVCREGIERVPVDQNLFSLYISCGELLGQAGRVDEAIILLQEGITRIPADKSLVTLYQSSAELLAQAGRVNEAIILLQEGMGQIPSDKSLVALYVSCGELLEQVGRVDEAITLIKEGMSRISAGQNLFSLYQSCGELLAQAGRTEEAITLLQEGIDCIPADKGLGDLYVRCGKVLTFSDQVAAAIALLREGINHIPVGRSERYRLVESALFLCAATGDIATLESLLSGTGPNAIDPSQVALGRVLRLQIQREWKLAAEAAHRGAREHPLYSQLFIQEAFSWLCVGDAKGANEALQRFPRPITIDKGSSIGWLKALVSLKNGDQQTARESLLLYLGRTLTNQEDVTIDLLVRLWDTPPHSFGSIDLAFYYPTLPTSITGLSHNVTRLEYGPPVLHVNASTLPEMSATALAEAGVRNTQLKSAQSTTDSTVIVDLDQLIYRIEDQPWYAPDFPPTTEIDQEQIKLLSNEIDVVIIIATDVEMRAVMHLLEPYPRKRSVLKAFVGPETYYLGKLGEHKVVVTKCRMGSIGEGSVILATTQAQSVWHPKAIIMVGVAFGKDPARQKIGDVLVASQIISYEQQRVGEQVTFRGPIPPSNTTLLNRFENAPTWRFARPDGKYCDLLVGPILSGEKLVDDPDFKARLFQQFPQAIGGEMEGAGLCAASGRIGVAWILVKSICDWGDGKKHNHHQPLAAAAAVSLVHHVLSQKTVLSSIDKQ